MSISDMIPLLSTRCRDGRDGKDGKDGKDGIGINGKDGKDGRDGEFLIFWDVLFSLS